MTAAQYGSGQGRWPALHSESEARSRSVNLGIVSTGHDPGSRGQTALAVETLRPQPAGKRPGIIAEAILDDWQTECRKAGRIAIGTDDQVQDLGPQALDNMSEDRSASGSRHLSPPPMRPDRPPANSTPTTSSGASILRV
jgi:hypothetical protein